MVLLARGNESVLLDLGLVERLYFNSGGLHSADLIFYGLQYVFPGLWLMLLFLAELVSISVHSGGWTLCCRMQKYLSVYIVQL